MSPLCSYPIHVPCRSFTIACSSFMSIPEQEVKTVTRVIKEIRKICMVFIEKRKFKLIMVAGIIHAPCHKYSKQSARMNFCGLFFLIAPSCGQSEYKPCQRNCTSSKQRIANDT